MDVFKPCVVDKTSDLKKGLVRDVSYFLWRIREILSFDLSFLARNISAFFLMRFSVQTRGARFTDIDQIQSSMDK